MEISSISTAQPTAPTPPPGGNIENRQPPSAPPQTNGTSEGNHVNYDTLKLLQEILDDYSDVSGLNSEKQSELASRLQDAGLLEPGILLDTMA